MLWPGVPRALLSDAFAPGPQGDALDWAITKVRRDLPPRRGLHRGPRRGGAGERRTPTCSTCSRGQVLSKPLPLRRCLQALRAAAWLRSHRPDPSGSSTKAPARHGGGWEVRAGHRAARLPVSGLVTGRGSEVEPGIRKSQNPSPRWGRQAVVQVWTEFCKPSTPFWKRFLPSSPRSCDQRVALLLSGGDRAGSRAPQRHQPAASFLQLGFTVLGPGVRRDGRALRRLRDPAGRTGRMSQRPRRHFQLRFVPAWNARPSAENAAAARKRCRL